MTPDRAVRSGPMLYVVNMTFDGGVLGETIEVEPVLVEDWIEAGFISPVDARGDRIVGHGPGEDVHLLTEDELPDDGP